MPDASPEENSIGKIAEEYLQRCRRGERPDISEYAARYPELADELRDLLPALLVMEELKPPSTDLTGDYATAKPARPPAERLGDFRILREVGRGGMGVVYEAEQESLGRRVALKVLPAQALPDLHQQKRFQREARAAARLHHTNIVPVFGVGEHDGMLYYVMQFIQGQGLDQVLADLKRLRAARNTFSAGSDTRSLDSTSPSASVAQALFTGRFAPQPGPQSDSSEGGKKARAPGESTRIFGDPESARPPAAGAPRPAAETAATGESGRQAASTLTDSGRHYWQSVARVGVQVAEALEYAHGQGIYHRDIKPSNLLLDTRGTVWVTDFGLAKAASDGDNLTHTGDILGTLRYMAPERFQGVSDARSDVYSLGLTLYEMLVLRPAFDETDRNKLIHQVTREDPPPPRRFNRAIPRDLETVVLKAIDREPARRYPSAAALGEDLKRFLEDKPIQARRVSVPEWVWRWCRRNPLTAGLTAGIAALLVIVAVAASVAAVSFGALAARESVARKKADEALDKAEAARADAVAAGQREAARRQEADEANQARLRAEAARADEEAKRRLAEVARRETERQERLKAQAAQKDAEENLLQARQAVDDYLTTVSESRLLGEPGLQPLRKELLESALKYYQGFLNKRGGDVALQKDVAADYQRVARVTAEIGTPAEALGHYAAAAKILNRLEPRTAEVNLALAANHQAVGHLHRRLGDHAAALFSFQEAYRLLIAVSPQDFKRTTTLTVLGGGSITSVQVHESDDPEILDRFLGVLNDIGAAHEVGGELGKALMRYLESLYVHQQLANLAPKKVLEKRAALGKADAPDGKGRPQQVYPVALKAGRSYAVSMESPDESFRTRLRIEDAAGKRLAEGDGGDDADAPLTFRPAVAGTYRVVVTTRADDATGKITLTILERYKTDAETKLGLAAQWARLGKLQGTLGLSKNALASYGQVREFLDGAIRSHPRYERLPDCQRDLASAHEQVAELEARADRLEQAVQSYRKALALRERLARDNPAVTEYEGDLAWTQFELGTLHARADQPAEALKALQQAVERQHRLVERAPKVTAFRRALGRQLGGLGDVHRKLDNQKEAAQAYQEARQLLEHLPPEDGDDLYALARAQAAGAALAGDAAGQKTQADAAFETLRKAVAAGYRDLARLEKDADLDALRPRAEFRSLLEGMRQRVKVLRWADDLEAAKAQAAREKKDLFLWFDRSGSATLLGDVFRKSHLGSEAFIDYAARHFVMVDLDANPTKKTAKHLTTVRDLTTRWKLKTTPALVLADAQGRPYEMHTGVGLRSSVDDYLRQLDGYRQKPVKRDEYLAKAAAGRGQEKARWLDHALKAVPKEFIPEYADVIEQIVLLDPDDRAGLRAEYLPPFLVSLGKLDRFVAGSRGTVAKIDALLPDLEPGLAPAAGLLHFLSGFALFDAGHPERATHALSRAVQSVPGSAAIWGSMALALAVSGQDNEARQVCRVMLARFGGDAASFPFLARACSLLPDTFPNKAAAEKLLKQSAPILLKNPGNTRSFGRLLYRAGQFDQARKTLESVVKQFRKDDPHLPLDLAFLAMVHHRLGHAADALGWLDRAERQKGEGDAAFSRLEEKARPAFYRIDHLDEELILVEAAALIRGSPAAAAPPARLASARAHARLSQWGKALAEYDRLLEQGASEGYLWLERGRVQQRLGFASGARADFAQAVAAQAKAVEMQQALWQAAPANPERREALGAALEGLARIQGQAGKPLDAAATYRRVQDLWPDDLQRLYDMAENIAGSAAAAARTGLDGDTRRALVGHALAALRKAAAAGQGLGGLERIPSWAPLLKEAEFAKWRGEFEVSQKIPLPSIELRQFTGHEGRAFAVSLTPDGRRILSGGVDGTARLWDLLTGQEQRQFRPRPGNYDILDVPVSPDGRRVLLGCDPIPEFDLETGKPLRLLPGHTEWVKPVRYLPDGRRALAAGSDTHLVLWDLETGLEIRRFRGHTAKVRNLALSADGRRALSCGNDLTVRWWDVESGLELGSYHGHRKEVWALALAPDGRRFVSGDQSGLVILWDTEEGREIRRETFPDRIWSAAFSPDGRFVLVGGSNLLVPWDVATGEVWYPDRSGTPRQIAFFKDGRYAVTAEESGLVRLWSVSEGAARAAHFVKVK
jgi:serine/threonine protein kinase/tetratricopeptide (TPR) repeat protein